GGDVRTGRDQEASQVVADEAGGAGEGDATAGPEGGVGGGHRFSSRRGPRQAAQLVQHLAVEHPVQLLDATGDRPAVHDAGAADLGSEDDLLALPFALDQDGRLVDRVLIQVRPRPGDIDAAQFGPALGDEAVGAQEDRQPGGRVGAAAAGEGDSGDVEFVAV